MVIKRRISPVTGTPQTSVGDVIDTSKSYSEVTLPFPLRVAQLMGNFTERDKKLYTVLLHAAHKNLLEEKTHTIALSSLSKIFENSGGGKDSGWYWRSARNLASTTIEWVTYGEDGQSVVHITPLLSYASIKAGSGILSYEFPERLLDVLTAPFRFGRIRTHFLIGLSGKYSVTLYEIFEAFTRDGVLEVSIGDLRQWLGIKEGLLEEFKAFRRRVLEPAMTQINESSHQVGFTVELIPIKDGVRVVTLRFILTKTPERIKEEQSMKRHKSNYRGVKHKFRSDVYEKAKRLAPGLDIYAIEQEFNEWVEKKGKEPDKPEAAFYSFCSKKAKQYGRR